MDIARLTIKGMQVLIKRVQKEINKRGQQGKSKLVDDIAQVASKHGYSLQDLIGTVPRPAKGKKARSRVALAWTAAPAS